MKKLFISHDRLSQALARGRPRPYLAKQWPLATLYGGQLKGGQDTISQMRLILIY
jgi:hypothetical protein